MEQRLSESKRHKFKRWLKGKEESTLQPPGKSKDRALPLRPGSGQSENSQNLQSQSLWETAFEKLSNTDKAVLDAYRSTDTDLITSILSVAKKKQEECQQHQWRFLFFGKEVALREIVERITRYVSRFLEVGDVVVQFDPTHAALPWAAVRFLLQVVVSENEQHSTLLLGIEKVAYWTSCCCIHEKLYLADTATPQTSTTIQARDSLKTALLALYGQILKFLVVAVRTFSKSSAARLASAWFSAEGLKTWLQELETLESMVTSAVSSCSVILLSDNQKKLQKMVEDLGTPISRIETIVSLVHRRLGRQEREGILKWISNLPYEELHYFVGRNRTEGTSEWLLQHESYLEWRNAAVSTTLWLHGSPGTGKTKLATAVVDKLKNSVDFATNGVVYFYCNRGQSDRRDPRLIFASFVRQLSTSAPSLNNSLPACVVDCYESKQAKGFASGSLTIEESKSLFHQLARPLSTLTIIVDGLDECEPGSRMQLVDALNTEAARSTAPFKILITSRPDRDIKDHFKIGPNLEINKWNNQDDITKYVRERIDNHSPSRWRNEVDQGLRNFICQALLDKCQGMFQWAVLQIEQLFKLTRRRDIYARLGKLPADLDKAYDEIYESIKKLDGSDPEVAYRAFLWVLCSYKAPSSQLLKAAVCQDPKSDVLDSVDIDDVEYILDVCQNLLVYDVKLDEFRFAHLSVREYFEAHVTTNVQGHAMLAKICLTLLIDPELYAACHPEIADPDDWDWSPPFSLPHVWQDWYRPKIIGRRWSRNGRGGGFIDIENPDLDGLYVTSSEDVSTWIEKIAARGGLKFLHCVWPLLHYARRYWARHIKAAGSTEVGTTTSEVKKLLQEFFGSFERTSLAFESWLEFIFMDTVTEDDFASICGIPGSCWALCGSGWQFDSMHPFKLWGGKSLFGICMTDLEGVTTELWSNLRLDNKILDLDGNTILMAIAATNSIAMARHALKNVATENVVDAKDNFLSTELAIAANNGRLEMVELLLDHGANINAQDSEDQDALSGLHDAARKSHFEVVKLLLDRGADVNAKGGFDGYALQAVCDQIDKDNQNLNIVRSLLNYGADVNAKGGFHGYALQAAACQSKADRAENEETVRLLLCHGAEVNAKGGYYGYALHAAASCSLKNIVKLLLDHNAEVNIKGGKYGYALHAAASGGDESIVRTMLDHGANVNAKGGEDGYALQAAAYGGRQAIVRLLLDYGASVNAKGGECGYALQAAAYGGHEGTVRLLLDHGADVNAEGGEYGHALQAACFGGNEVISLLLEHGAKVNVRGGRYGYTLHAAAFNGKVKPMRLLLDHGADINAKTEKLGCALHVAVSEGEVRAVKFLLNHGAKVNAKYGKHGTCLHEIRKLMSDGLEVPESLIPLLLRYGAIDEPAPSSVDEVLRTTFELRYSSQAMNEREEIGDSWEFWNWWDLTLENA